MKYVVEVHAPVVESPQTLARKLVEGFNVRGEIARDFIKLIPGTVTKPVTQQEASAISTMLSGIGLQVSTRQVEARNPASSATLKGRNALRSKIMASILLPVLLAFATTLGVMTLTVRPALQTHLFTSARNPAILFASVAERVIGSNSINSWAALGELDAVLEDARESFQGQNISFIMLADTVGKPLVGWYGDDSALTTLPSTLRTTIQLQSQRVTAKGSGTNPGEIDVDSSLSQTVEISGQRLEVAAEAVTVNGQPLGAVVVGIHHQNLIEETRSVLTNTLFAGAVPVFLAILLGFFVTRAVRRDLTVKSSTEF
jgi:hypothetical protein